MKIWTKRSVCLAFIPLSHGTEGRSLTVVQKHRQFGTNKNKSIKHKKKI